MEHLFIHLFIGIRVWLLLSTHLKLLKFLLKHLDSRIVLPKMKTWFGSVYKSNGHRYVAVIRFL